MGSRMTNSRPTGILSAALLAITTFIPVAACPGQGVAERAGEVLDNAGRSILLLGRGGAVARGQAAVREQGDIYRVYSRIHWDKVRSDWCWSWRPCRGRDGDPEGIGAG